MSLDKWLKKDEREAKKEEKQVELKKKKQPKSTNEIKSYIPKEEKTAILLKKYVLYCAKCKYQKTLMKKKLVDKDLKCPKCKGKMKIKKT